MSISQNNTSAKENIMRTHKRLSSPPKRCRNSGGFLENVLPTVWGIFGIFNWKVIGSLWKHPQTFVEKPFN